MANLPMDRTKLNAAITNQQPSVVASSQANREALVETADTIDLLNQKVDSNIAAGALAPYPPSFLSRQAIINGNFDVWQRGTSFAINNFYTADRWFTSIIANGTTGTISRQPFAIGQTDVPNNPKYFKRINPTTLDGCIYFVIEQRIEGVEKFAGGKATVSFYAKADTAQNLDIYLRQNFGTEGSPSGSIELVKQAKSLSTSWAKYTATFDVPSIAGKTKGSSDNDYLALVLGLPNTGVYSIDIAQVQLCAGEAALPFQPRTFAEELALCQRYYRTFGDVKEPISSGLIFNTTTALFALTYGEMRVPPTITFSSAGDFVVVNNATVTTPTAISANFVQRKGAEISATVSGVTQGQGAYLRGNNSVGNKITLDAEL